MSRTASPPKASLSHARRLDRPAPPPPQRRLLSGTLTVGAHLAIIGALFWLHGAAGQTESKPEPTAMQVSLLPKPPGPADEQQAEAGGAPAIALPQPPKIPAPVITIATAPNTSDLLSEAQLAGASRAGEGSGGGGGCDMARAAQQALRRDRLVTPALADAGRLGKASMLWNGDWVRSGDQDGKGLAAVRQAILWEVGFSPEACRNERMHGMVVLSLADGTRFAIGAGEWRWSDLLGLKRR